MLRTLREAAEDPTSWEARDVLVEIGSLAVSIVTLLMARLDRHRDAISSQPELREALILVHDSLARWLASAHVTNIEVRAFIAGVSTPQQLRARFGYQTSDASGWVSYLTEGKPEEESAEIERVMQVLAIYAPDLGSSLTQVVSSRLEQLAALQEELAPIGGGLISRLLRRDNSASEQDTQLSAEKVAELDRTEAGLGDALDMLSGFIRSTFPLDTTPDHLWQPQLRPLLVEVPEDHERK